jgi:alkylation response protein AidB-like acyl-CoA dehydrogenase
MTDSDTLRMLEDAARGFAAFDAGRVRRWRETPPGFDREKWREMAEQGWFGILVGEEDGGLGLGLDAAAAVAKVLGYNAMPEPFVAAGVLAPKLLASCPVSPTRDTLLASVVAGEKIATVAHLDNTGELAFGASGVRARKGSGGYTLNGEFRFVPVPDADVILAPVVIDLAREGEAANLCRAELLAIDRATPGVDVEREGTADGGASGWIRFNNADVPAEAMLASGDFWPLIEEALDYGVMANSAELLGIMDRALELTLEYLKTRKQFGKAIGSFQVLQHRAVDLWMHRQIAEHAFTASLKVVMAPDVPAAARQQATSSAKARVARTALDLGNDCIQLHGAIGFTDEYDLALYVNRSLAIAPFGGNAGEHLKRYGDLKQRNQELAR